MGAIVLTLWYEPLRGETGLAASTPFVEIWQDRRMPVVRLSGKLPHDPSQWSAQLVMDYSWLMPGEAIETHPLIISSNNRGIDKTVSSYISPL